MATETFQVVAHDTLHVFEVFAGSRGRDEGQQTGSGLDLHGTPPIGKDEIPAVIILSDFILASEV
nr:hypothetical protein [Egicoccus halophilus]